MAYPSHWAAGAVAAIRLAPNMGYGIAQHEDAVMIRTLLPRASGETPASTIHAVKGMEFPAVCVVMTSQSAARILEHLEGAGDGAAAEEARKIYVAASRAQRALVFAVPHKQAERLQTLLTSEGASVELCAL